MTMLLSKACEYGLRAALSLTEGEPSVYVPIREVSERLGIPYHFLAKIVQVLIQHGILESARGPSGGVRLARPATQIALKEIVLAIDGGAIFTECVLGLPGCGTRKPCPFHDQWGPVRDSINNMFEEATLAAMTARIRDGDLRLATLAGGSS